MASMPEWLDHQLEKGTYVQRASDEFYVALGVFMTKFADAEHGARVLAVSYSGIRDDRGRIVFGNMDFLELHRLVPALSRLIHNGDVSEELEALFERLHILYNCRNQLLRARISHRAGEDAAVYVPAGQTIGKALDGGIVPDDMNKMAADCELIKTCFELLGRANPPSRAEMELIHPSWKYEAN